MKPWSDVQEQELESVRGVCFDIDDTFSSEGKILSQTYQSLWDLRDAGYFLVPITGRPAGWCDHIARFWPVDAVVGENGAFSFFMNEGRRERIDTLGEDTSRGDRLVRLRKTIETWDPGVRFASDQAYREYDLAIDFCEDVKPWSRSKIDELVSLCRGEGAQAKVSSIHVNTWYGDFDKEKGFRRLLDSKLLPTLPGWKNWIFIGDSPNDEPLFRAFDRSVGVANISQFEADLKNPPTWVTAKRSGKGFVEFATRLCSKVRGQ